MEFDETMVEENGNVEADDALPEDVVEVEDESEEDLEQFIGEDEEPEQPAEEKTEKPQGTSEPGWIKKRVGEAVEKALARQRESLKAEFDAQYAPIRERLLEMDAQELVRKGEVKNIDIARELVRARQGMPPQQTQPVQQPRDDNGRFASSRDNTLSLQAQTRIDMLKHQAERISAASGIDVIQEFSNNEDIKRKVIAGEMDFYDVAETMKKPKKRPPSPTRSPNGVNGIGPNSIEGMSDAQFRKLDKMLDQGVRFTVKR